MIGSEFSIGSQEFRICDAHSLDRNAGEVITDLQQMKGLLQSLGPTKLREIWVQLNSGQPPGSNITEQDLIDNLAWNLVYGTLGIQNITREKATLGQLKPTPASPSPSPKQPPLRQSPAPSPRQPPLRQRPPPPPSQPPPRRRPAPAPELPKETVSLAHFQQDAQASTLAKAAENGVPFCEVCEKAKQEKEASKKVPPT